MTTKVISEAFEISSRMVDFTLVLRLRGSADVSSIYALRVELNRAAGLNPDCVELDLAELDFIASLAIGAIVEFARAVRNNGGVVRISNARGYGREVLRRCRMTDVLDE